MSIATSVSSGGGEEEKERICLEGEEGEGGVEGNASVTRRTWRRPGASFILRISLRTSVHSSSSLPTSTATALESSRMCRASSALYRVLMGTWITPDMR